MSVNLQNKNNKNHKDMEQHLTDTKKIIINGIYLLYIPLTIYNLEILKWWDRTTHFKW